MTAETGRTQTSGLTGREMDGYSQENGQRRMRKKRQHIASSVLVEGRG